MKRYSIEEIRKWLNQYDPIFSGPEDIIKDLDTFGEKVIDEANGYLPNTHVEDENKFEEGEEAHATEKGIRNTDDYEDYLEKEGPDPAHDGIY